MPSKRWDDGIQELPKPMSTPTWASISTIDPIFRCSSIAAGPSGSIYAAGLVVSDTKSATPSIFASRDTGETWQQMYANEVARGGFSDIVVGPNGTVISVGSIDIDSGYSGAIVRSIDAGSTWELRLMPDWVMITDAIVSVEFAADGDVFATGRRGSILRSDDGGEYWVASYVDAKAEFESISVKGHSEFWAVGTHVMRSERRGRLWEERVVDGVPVWLGVEVLRERCSVLFGQYGGIAVTLDGNHFGVDQIDDIGDFRASLVHEGWLFLFSSDGFIAGAEVEQLCSE